MRRFDEGGNYRRASANCPRCGGSGLASRQSAAAAGGYSAELVLLRALDLAAFGAGRSMPLKTWTASGTVDSRPIAIRPQPSGRRCDSSSLPARITERKKLGQPGRVEFRSSPFSGGVPMLQCAPRHVVETTADDIDVARPEAPHRRWVRGGAPLRMVGGARSKAVIEALYVT
jgi:hypothetical protein